MFRRTGVALVLFALAAALPIRAERDHVADLVNLCEVWSSVKYLDPRPMQRDVDWDGALVNTIPKVRAATNEDEVAAAVGEMLATLGDPASRVVRRPAAASKPVELFRRDGDVLIVNFGPYADANSAEALFDAAFQINDELAKSKRVVFDLRSETDAQVGWVFERLGVASQEVTPPPFRRAFHSGYAPQSGTTSGGYYSGLIVTPSSPLRAARGAAPSRVVFVVRDEVPSAVAGLWWSGLASVISEREISDANVGSVTIETPLGGPWKAVTRTAEMAVTGFRPDAVVMPSENDATMRKAVAIALDDTPLPPRPPQREHPALPLFRQEKRYADMKAPELPYRLLALFRFWSVIDRFYPYKHLLSDWNSVLREFIPRMEQARTADDYALTVMELSARVEDGHSYVNGHPAFATLTGPARVPLEIRRIDGEYVVTGKYEKTPADLPISVGDVVVSIDGEPVEERVKRLWKYFPASTEIARRHRVVDQGSRGAAGTSVELVVRGSDDKERTVSVPRQPWSPKVVTGEVFRVLDDDIGYVDLTRLQVAEVDAMFDKLAQTRAIIFDMRGYPNGTAWSIAPRINTTKANAAATFRRPQLSEASEGIASSGFWFDQSIPTTDKALYQGRTVMLIDDRTISQAEHTGLFFEAANGTTFIGSNSAGANGDVTDTVLPGGIVVTLSGHDVRHADGRQLQRIGLVPDVPVVPTLRGIREGRDEVLEKAIEYLKNER